MASRNERRYATYCKRKNAYVRRWRAANPERARANGREWRIANREKVVLASRRWAQENSAETAAKTAYRRAYQFQATPMWLTAEQKSEMLEFYKEAARLGLAVDHVIPLKGKTVCGLHVPWNLQFLSHSENSSKGNRLGG